MNRQLASLTFAVLLACSCSALNLTATPGPVTNATGQTEVQSSGGAQNASVIPIVLSKTLDARKLKAGDPVEAKTTSDLSVNGLMVPRGTTVKGHITQASARSKGGEQTLLGMVFDTVALRDGQPMALKASIQAVGAAPVLQPGMLEGEPEAPVGSAPGSPGNPSVTSPPMIGGGNPSPLGGVQQPRSNLPQDSSQQQNGRNSATLNEKSTGVVGLRNVQLQSGSTLTSNGKDLKLDAGTEMILRVQSE